MVATEPGKLGRCPFFKIVSENLEMLREYLSMGKARELFQGYFR